MRSCATAIEMTDSASNRPNNQNIRDHWLTYTCHGSATPNFVLPTKRAPVHRTSRPGLFLFSVITAGRQRFAFDFDQWQQRSND